MVPPTTDRTPSFSLSTYSPTSPHAPPLTRASMPEDSSHGTSSPAILAIIAIGFFAVFMSIVGWRRYQLGRFGPWRFVRDDLTSTGDMGWGRPKPQLWDLWTVVANARDHRISDGGVGWAFLMPMSANVISDGVAKHCAAVARNDNPATSATRRLIASISVLYHQWAGRQPTAKVKATPSRDSLDENGSRLQVIVTIAMPSRRIIHEGTNDANQTGNGGKHEDQGGGGDALKYALGVYECGWKVQ